MGIFKTFLKQAITFEEYKNLHPKTRKTPHDPLFTKEKKKPVDKKPVSDPSSTAAPAQIKKTRQPKIKTDEELLAKYAPKFSGGPYQRPMTKKELLQHVDKFEADDVAWHLTNGKNDVQEILDKPMRKHMGFAQALILQLFNKNISKKEKDSTASYLIDKAGVTFVGGRTLNNFLTALANKGVISKHLVEVAKHDEVTSQIWGNGITDPEELRKYAKEKDENGNMKYSYQLKNNRFAPPDVVLDVFNDYLNQRGNSFSDFIEIMKKPNFPISEFFNKKNRKVQAVITNIGQSEFDKILWSRSDCPENFRENLIKKKLDEGGYGPPAFEISEENFNKLWKNALRKHKNDISEKNEKEKSEKFDPLKYATDVEYALDDIAKHPNCPEKILREILSWKNRPGSGIDGPEPTTIGAIDRAKKIAFKQAFEKGYLKSEEIISAVNKKLNLHGDPEILHKFGEQAFVRDEPIKNSIKRTVKKCSNEEKERIKQEMAKTAVHDDFDFDIVEAYEVDVEPHRDFDKTAKKIGNVKSNIYHGTSFGNAGGILAEGVNIGSKSRTGQMFGQGFYLASASSKAVQYASESFAKNEGEGVVFVLDTALGKTNEMKYGLPHSEKNNHANNDEEEKMFEAYKKKHGRYPPNKWHMTHDSVTAKAGMTLDHDEFVVKDPSQIKIKRIIHVKKKPKAE